MLNCIGITDNGQRCYFGEGETPELALYAGQEQERDQLWHAQQAGVTLRPIVRWELERTEDGASVPLPYDFEADSWLGWYCHDPRYPGPLLPRNHRLWQFRPGGPVMLERWRDD